MKYLENRRGELLFLVLAIVGAVAIVAYVVNH
jgi:hypothetical protein